MNPISGRREQNLRPISKIAQESHRGTCSPIFISRKNLKVSSAAAWDRANDRLVSTNIKTAILLFTECLRKLNLSHIVWDLQVSVKEGCRMKGLK